MILQNDVQLGRCPPPPGICLLGEAQFILQVVGDPLCKLGGQPLEGGVVLAVGVLEPDLGRLLLGHVPDRGGSIVIRGSCSCRHPSWLEKVQITIKLHRAAQCSAQVSINQDIPFAKWDNLDMV